eukprot:6186002-Pleurochrysis_carterae.AAC.1
MLVFKVDAEVYCLWTACRCASLVCAQAACKLCKVRKDYVYKRYHILALADEHRCRHHKIKKGMALKHAVACIRPASYKSPVVAVLIGPSVRLVIE